MVELSQMSPAQITEVYNHLVAKDLIKAESNESHKGLVKKKVTVKRGGKTFEQERWVKGSEDEPEDKPKKGEEEPGEKPTAEPKPEKPKGPVIMGLNKPEGEKDIGEDGKTKPEETTTPEKPEKGEEPDKTESETTKSEMTKENVESIGSLSDMGVTGGINEDYTSIVNFKDGSKGIYKTTDKAATQGEITVQEISSILGWDVAPETVKGDFGKGEGSCQKWVPDTVEIDYGESWDEGIKIEEKHFDDLAKIFLLDLMTGNYDRHANNIKIDKNDKVWAIDNDTWGTTSIYSPTLDMDFDECRIKRFMNIASEDGINKFQTYIDKNMANIIKNKKGVKGVFEDIIKRQDEFKGVYEDDDAIGDMALRMIKNLDVILNYKKERDEYYA